MFIWVCNVLKCPNYTYFKRFVLCLSRSLFKFLASWHVVTLQFSVLLSHPPKYVTGAQQRSSSTLFMCPRTTLSRVSLIVSQVSDSSKHYGFAHSRSTSREEELEVRCVRVCLCMHRGGGVLRYSTVFSSVFYCWISVNPKQRWHCCISSLAMRQVCTQHCSILCCPLKSTCKKTKHFHYTICWSSF